MPATHQSRIALGDRVVDLDEKVVLHGDRTIGLTDGEVALLRVLGARDGEPVTRATLLVEALGYAPGVKSRAVDYAVNRLRRKLEDSPAEPVHLLSAFGVGYRLASAEAADAALLPGEPLLGRSADLARLDATVGPNRLVTVTGPGGVGKTRLVTTWAAARGDAVHCDLGAAADLDDLVVVVARGLELRLAGDELAGRVAQIGRVLRARDGVVLVLDGFEQLDEACADAVVSWVGMARSAAVLLTSRRPLGVPDERLLPLSPLAALPASHLLRTLIGGTPDDAVLDRIVELVEGIPLALELAAAGARALGAESTAVALQGALEDLDVEPGEDPRAARLRAVVRWTVDRLPVASRRAAAACGAFVGGFDRQAWAAVVGSDAQLDALGDAGLVSLDGERARLLEPVRQFARERLDQHPDAAGIRAAHARHYADEAGPHALELRLEGRSAWMAREHANLIAAIAAAHGPLPEVAVRAGLALDELQIADSPAEERVRRLGWLLVAAERASTAQAAEVHRRLADARRRVGQADLGLVEVQVALRMAEDLGDVALAGRCRQTLGSIELARGRYVEARAQLERACAALIEHEAPYWAAVARFNLGTTLQIMGDSVAAEEAYRAALASAEEAGATWLRPTIGSGLAVVYLERGQAGKAKLLLERALAQGRGRIARLYELHLERNLGHVDLALGDLRAAAVRFAQLVRDARIFGEPFLLSDALVGQARTDAFRGKYSAAEAAFVEARELYAAQGRPTFEGLAAVHGAVATHLRDPAVDVRDGLREGLAQLDPTAATARVEALCYLAAIASDHGDLDAAEKALEEAESLAEGGTATRLFELGRLHVEMRRGSGDLDVARTAVSRGRRAAELGLAARLLAAALPS